MPSKLKFLNINREVIEDALLFNPRPLDETMFYLNNSNGTTATHHEITNFIDIFNAKAYKDPDISFLIQRNTVMGCITAIPALLQELVKNTSALNELPNLLRELIVSTQTVYQIAHDNTQDDILKVLDKSSLSFENIVYDIHGISLQRKETATVLDWIIAPCQEFSKEKKASNTCLILGTAGSGKSTIIRQIWKRCTELEIPVLAMKADREGAKDLNELSGKLKLPMGILELIDYLGAQLERSVVIIDQIDALSQYLSMNRLYINCYLDIIHYVSKFPNIKLVVSCREFDFEYDESLRRIQTDSVIRVSPFSKEEICQILVSVNVDYDKLSPAIQKISASPYYLSLIIKLAVRGIAVDQLVSPLKIHDKIWDEFITRRYDRQQSDEVDAIMRLVTVQITRTSMFNVAKAPFMSQYHKTVDRLISDSMLSENQGFISFCHTSFYDYCFAKFFVLDGKDIVKFILDSDQGLFIRPQIKMILDYCGDNDHSAYATNVLNMLVDNKVRFHIKLLLLDLLGFRDDVSPQEFSIANRIINDGTELITHFIDSISSESWLSLLFNKGFVKTCICHENKSVQSHMISKLSQMSDLHSELVQKIVLSYETYLSPAEIHWVIYRMSSITNLQVIDVLIRIYQGLGDDEYSKEDIMKLIVRKCPEKGLTILFTSILDKVEGVDWKSSAQHDDVIDHWEYDCLSKQLMKSDTQQKVIYHSLILFDVLASKSKFTTEFPFKDLAFDNIWNFENSLHTHWQLYRAVVIKLCELSHDSPQTVDGLIKPYINTESYAIIALLLEVYSNNSSVWKDNIFQVLIKSNILKEDGIIKHLSLLCINSVFSNYTQDQQTQFVDYIMGIHPKYEFDYLKNGIKTNLKSDKFMLSFNEWFRNTGYKQYTILAAIPEAALRTYQRAFDRFNVLYRKFGVVENSRPKAAEAG